MGIIACTVFHRAENNGIKKWLRPFFRKEGVEQYFDASANRFQESFAKHGGPTMFQILVEKNVHMRVTNMSSLFKHAPIYGMTLAPGSAVQEEYARVIMRESNNEMGSFSGYFIEGADIRGGAVLWWDEGRDLVWSVSAELLRLVYARLQFTPDISKYVTGVEVSAIIPLKHFQNDVARWKHVKGHVIGNDNSILRIQTEQGKHMDVDPGCILNEV